MSNLGSDDLSRQMENLLRSNRRLFMLVVFLCCAVLLIFFTGFQRSGTQDVLEARQFVVRDKNNRIMSRLHLNEDGLPELVFYDKAGKLRLEMGLWNLGGALSMNDRDGHTVLSMSANEVGSTQFNLSQPGGKSISLMSAGPPDNRALISLGDDLNDKLLIELNPHDSKIQFFGVGAMGDPLRLSLESHENGTSDISFFDKSGDPALVQEIKVNGGASLRILGGQGKNLFRAP